MKRVHLLIHGIVQNVGYRRFAEREARRFCITGWVRNRSDGNVELEAQGNDDELLRFIAWTKRGAPTGRVDRVDENEIVCIDNETTFEIRIDH